MLFTGEYEPTLDSKNRLSIPARLREVLDGQTVGEKFYLILGLGKKLWLYPNLYYEQLVSQRPPEQIPAEETLISELVTFPLARLVELDSQGRVLLPDNMIQRASLGKEVMILGMRDHIQLWNRKQWFDFIEDKLARHSEMLIKARMTRPPASQAGS